MTVRPVDASRDGAVGGTSAGPVGGTSTGPVGGACTGPVGAAAAVRALVADVPDPEIPVLTIADLGVLRDVTVDDRGRVRVDITPTYSGCPAMDAIRADVEARLAAAGHRDAEVRLVLSPAWTTDWMSAAGRRKLADYGIAPPSGRAAVHASGTAVPASGTPVSGVPASAVPVSGVPVSGTPVSGVPVSGEPASAVPASAVPASAVPASAVPASAVPVSLSMRCPQCGSPDTRELSRFGSTACKSLWRCLACREPFDSFKVH